MDINCLSVGSKIQPTHTHTHTHIVALHVEEGPVMLLSESGCDMSFTIKVGPVS